MYGWNGTVLRLIRVATGEEFTPAELEDTLDRIYLQEMAFNVRQRMSRADERMPQRPEVAGTDAGREDLQRHAGQLDAFYRLHGCDPETGVSAGTVYSSNGTAGGCRHIPGKATGSPCRKGTARPPSVPPATHPGSTGMR